ncbi:MAG: hypothetical protein HY912_11640 [Desulfomonile tiedjei]|uniref:Uncharacterized protein n=1 Tax=Desulfomonile tiedjei TaxID=2358 RepID=A0A9D6V543_9BACT|nr:hypothetical protein [Desulfomonile tiedjei]
MQTVIVILAVIYAVIGVAIYFMTMNKSDALIATIESHSPMNTIMYTKKWLWLLIIFGWPVWLLIQEKLPDQEKKGPF